MLSKLINKNKSGSIISYKKDSFNFITKDYQFKLKPDFIGEGIRYLHYYVGDTTLLMSNTSADGCVRLLNLSNGCFRTFIVSNSRIRKIEVYNNELITSGWDATVTVSNYNTFKIRLKLWEYLMGRCPEFIISGDGRHLYSYSYDTDFYPPGRIMTNKVRKWNLTDGTRECEWETSPIQNTLMKGGAILLYQDKLYSCCDSGYIRVYDIHTNDLITEIITDTDFSNITSLERHGYFLIYDRVGEIYFFNIRTNKIDRKVKAYNSHIMCLRIHPNDPDIVISACSNGVIKFWKMPEFKLINEFEDSLQDPWSFVFINGRMVVGNMAGEARVYDISDVKDIVYKGKITYSGKSFVVQVPESKMFFTNDLSAMEAFRTNDTEEVTGKEAEHLLNQSNNIMVLHELFGTNASPVRQLLGQGKIVPLLPDWIA